MSIPTLQSNRTWRSTLAMAVAICLYVVSLSPTFAGPREQAKRIYDRLAGVPPTNAVLDTISGDPQLAATEAMNNPNFYNVTLKNFITPWTNKDGTVFADLNDYTATVIGVIRDQRDFREILFENIIYVGDSSLSLPTYSNSNNNHYSQMETSGADLSDTNNLVMRTQTQITGLADVATAGVITTRAGAGAFFYAGTNRAQVRFTLMNHLCNDLEQVKDITRSPDRIRKDVSRSPGGDSRIFLNNCIGCHSGMDGLAGAFAYYEWQYDPNTDPQGINGQMIYTQGTVQGKHLINDTNFRYGYVTTDDSWINYWRRGPNGNNPPSGNNRIGWGTYTGLNLDDGHSIGNGAKSLGVELANTNAFAECQVKKVFKAVCFREPTGSQIQTMTTNFTANYNLKDVFAEAAVICMGN